MRGLRFSIANLLVLVLFAGVALAALRGADDLWDSGVFTVALGLLVLSVLLGVHFRGRKRAFWLGFALCGGLYLAASLVPAVEARLMTTKALAFIDSKVPRVAVRSGVALVDLDNDGDLDLFVVDKPNSLYANNGLGKFTGMTADSLKIIRTAGAAGPTGVPALWRSLISQGGTSENFVRIGHSLIALVVAFAGGCLSRRLTSHAREDVEPADRLDS
jgi:hypothetical protein